MSPDNTSVLLIYTGGTIGMIENAETGALENFNFEHLQKHVPELQNFTFRIDTYQFDRNAYLAGMDRALSIIDSIGKAHNKVIAVTETGYEGIPDAKWWTGTLLPALEKYPLAYVLVWRNAREKVTHYYAPYPGQTSAEDFVEFYNNPKTLFAADVNLYQ